MSRERVPSEEVKFWEWKVCKVVDLARSSMRQESQSNLKLWPPGDHQHGAVMIEPDMGGAQDTIYLCNFRVSVDGEWLCLKELQDVELSMQESMQRSPSPPMALSGIPSLPHTNRPDAFDLCDLLPSSPSHMQHVSSLCLYCFALIKRKFTRVNYM